MLYDGKDYYFSKKYAMHIVDRVGGGDSFGGGLIYACLRDMDAQSIIEFAVAASCLKHSIEGDMNMVSVDEVKKLAGGSAVHRKRSGNFITDKKQGPQRLAAAEVLIFMVYIEE